MGIWGKLTGLLLFRSDEHQKFISAIALNRKKLGGWRQKDEEKTKKKQREDEEKAQKRA
ncbi:hypothetical protein [Crocosphaera sp. Alani8]|uniref:hypothetical protein n=1 Tax=Crocosphaera sp. Alani8 TaxID=3038952 RepID=UPI00313E79B8